VHASVVAHYFDGGYYPRGGGGAIPRAYLRALRRAGGEIRVKTEVDRILVEGRRAIGVRLADGTEIRARHVISNADPQVTLGKLVGPEHLSWGARRKLARTRWSVSAISLFMATDLDVRAAGLDSGNYWAYPDADVEGTYRRGLEAWGSGTADVPGLFLTCTTLKDPTKFHGQHTLEAFTFVGYDAYRAWEQSRTGDRPAAYGALKQELLGRMIAAASKVVPGLDRHVTFAEIGTPLTNVHYCGATDGNLYGTEKSRFQVGPFGHQVATEIDGLLLCGASTIGHGVLGAAMSGLLAARSVLGGRIEDMLRQPSAPIQLVDANAPTPARRLRRAEATGAAAASA